MDDRIKKTLNYIEDNLSLTLGLADLANIACMSASQFHRAFKKATNRTPFQFIEEIKMNKAYQVLIHESVMVHQLSKDLGYKDYETFTRAFKKHFYCAPDDLKSIANKLKENLNPSEKDELIITTMDSDMDDVQLLEKLNQVIQEKNLSIEELKNARFFKVIEKSDSKILPKNLIKNKYQIELDGGKKIWESLIDPRNKNLNL